MNSLVLMSDPQVAAIPVRECGEPLVDVRDHSFRVDPRKQDPLGAFAHVREGVLARLEHARSLLPAGTDLLFIEGYRPLALQQRYFTEYRNELAAAHPGWTAERLHQAASRYVSPPEIAPHSAGAAVDVTLADQDGHELDLGTRVNASPEESDEGLLHSRPEPQRSRRSPPHAAAQRHGERRFYQLWTGVLALLGSRPVRRADAAGARAHRYGPIELP